jgi:hypothetical protein
MSANNPQPTASELAAIAAQFITSGDDEAEALRKANALYFVARSYLKEFAARSPDAKAIELNSEKALLKMADRHDLALGDSEANSPALAHFRGIAKTKLEQNITHKAFVNLIEREWGRRPEKVMPAVLENLHHRLRVKRSEARSKRRKKESVK